MGWTKLDTALERIRAMLAEDAAGAARAIADLLEETSSPSIRVRLFALLIGARRRLGDLEGARCAYEDGRKQRLRGRSRFARAELEWHAAELHIYRNDRDAGRRAADRALVLFRPLAMASEGRSKGGKRKHRLIRAMYAAALISSAQVAHHLEGNPYRALADALEALRIADPRYAVRVHLAAISAVALLTTRVGTANDAIDVLRLADEADRLLARRVPGYHPHRVKLAGIRALAFARLGSTEVAERILLEVIRELRALGLEDAADRAGLDLLWVIGERAGQVGRARYLRREMGLPSEEPPAEPEPDDSDPIGF